MILFFFSWITDLITGLPVSLKSKFCFCCNEKIDINFLSTRFFVQFKRTTSTTNAYAGMFFSKLVPLQHFSSAKIKQNQSQKRYPFECLLIVTLFTSSESFIIEMQLTNSTTIWKPKNKNPCIQVNAIWTNPIQEKRIIWRKNYVITINNNELTFRLTVCFNFIFKVVNVAL